MGVFSLNPLFFLRACSGQSTRQRASARVVCHGDILCVRTHTGRLLRLVAATEGDLPELSATAESHEDAQRWEVLMA